MSRPSIVLANSPAVGPSALLPLAEALRRRGDRVDLPAAPAAIDHQVAAVASCIGSGSVLVAYSAAGPRAYAIAAARPPAAIIFMDAALPRDQVAPDADPNFRDLLERLPLDSQGVLPPWIEWWSPDVLAEVCPDSAMRRLLASDCPELPRSVYAEPIPAPPYGGPCGYLAFGATYADDRAESERRGWPTATIAGARHLAPCVDPLAVAAALDELIAELGVDRRSFAG
ncbi:MAG TPA: hypothetical protein VMM60_09835 [Ilumatobacter sp.]|nr:hypothetical protein [Ilumatobacter sp.]